jgi:hypothetical protein
MRAFKLLMDGGLLELMRGMELNNISTGYQPTSSLRIRKSYR